MPDEQTQFEWKFPVQSRRFCVLMFSVSTLAFTAALIGSNLLLLGSKHAARLHLLSALMVVLLILVWPVLIYTFRRVENGRYFADEAGIHGQPGFDFAWSDLESVSLMDWIPSGTKILVMKARKSFRTRWIGLDPSSVDEGQLLNFAAKCISSSRSGVS